MGEYKVDDPELVDRFSTDSSGRVNLGTEYANSEVRVVVEDSEDDQKDRKITEFDNGN